jgi:ElaB/YqjD/DUF883 family membrane-anchored ribosome-binding protein
MSQLTEKAKKIEEVAVKLLSGILSNPNYNFENAKKAAVIAIDHARELVQKIVDTVETSAEKVAETADKVGDKIRGYDDDAVAENPQKIEEKKADPLSEM